MCKNNLEVSKLCFLLHLFSYISPEKQILTNWFSMFTLLISVTTFKKQSLPQFHAKMKVPPRFELGSQDSKSWVLTITPWDRWYKQWKNHFCSSAARWRCRGQLIACNAAVKLNTATAREYAMHTPGFLSNEKSF